MGKANTERGSEREQLVLARRLAASSQKREVIQEWLARRDAMQASRGGELVLPDHTADVAELQARLRARALTICEDIMVHSTNERNQLKAVELVLGLGAANAGEGGEYLPMPVHATAVSDEHVGVVRDLLAQKRQLARKAGGG